jgi:addiction module HigA family antidote
MPKLKPVHPGEVLREEFMIPFNLNANSLALALRVAPPAVYEIVKEERGISSEMALRLGRYFGTTADFWVNLQSHYELSMSRQRDEAKVMREIQPLATGA